MHEDPYLWFDRNGGFHLLTHCQNNHRIHATRGAYGWPADGITWTQETEYVPEDSNSSAYDMGLLLTNGTTLPFARRQRPQLVWNPDMLDEPIALINGADFSGRIGTRWG